MINDGVGKSRARRKLFKFLFNQSRRKEKTRGKRKGKNKEKGGKKRLLKWEKTRIKLLCDITSDASLSSLLLAVKYCVKCLSSSSTGNGSNAAAAVINISSNVVRYITTHIIHYPIIIKKKNRKTPSAKSIFFLPAKNAEIQLFRRSEEQLWE